MEEEHRTTTRDSIYKAARKIKWRDNSVYNALRSIFQDSIFVQEIFHLWPKLPLVANLRCDLWYSSLTFVVIFGTHFKSTDGERGGCIIVDSTRKRKRFPDSMSKTIPIWSCVLNRSIFNHFKRLCNTDQLIDHDDDDSSIMNLLENWDCLLHLPLWVSDTEKASIEAKLEERTRELDESGADIASIAPCLRKPLRPLWISQKSVIWLNEVSDHDSWDFTPLILDDSKCQTDVKLRRQSYSHL